MPGFHVQLNRGIGSEFHALREFQTGHDPRQIDWKQSARHNALIVREFRVEQNQHIVAMLDTGRLMSEPLLGQPRLDRALTAILLLFYVSLKLGDRCRLAAFDSQPRLSSGVVSGVRSFGQLQRLAASLDYSAEETNFTLGLTQLSADLEHRSIIFLFSDFSDTTSAELMLENVARLLARHTVLFVLFRDEEVEAMRRAEPRVPEDATRAVIAEGMARERDIVLAPAAPDGSPDCRRAGGADGFRRAQRLSRPQAKDKAVRDRNKTILMLSLSKHEGASRARILRQAQGEDLKNILMLSPPKHEDASISHFDPIPFRQAQGEDLNSILMLSPPKHEGQNPI